MYSLFKLNFIISIGASVALHGLVLTYFNFEAVVPATQPDINLAVKLKSLGNPQQSKTTHTEAQKEILPPPLATEIKTTKTNGAIKKYIHNPLPIENKISTIEDSALQNKFKPKAAIRNKVFESNIENNKVNHAKENYINNLRTAISNNQYYPLRARNMRLEGDLKVEFIIHSDGNIEKIIIKKSSGKSVLDRAAKNSIVKIGQYKPFPNDISASFLSVVVPMKYKID